MIRWIMLSMFVCTAAQAEPWESSLATVASLRTGGASLVSSDSIQLERGRFALITYWEARTSSDLDVYRCVDVTDSSFATISQTCWRALRPTGRMPRVVEGVTSSRDLCGQPGGQSQFSAIAFCTYSEAFAVQTIHFKVLLAPFEHGGLVAVRDQGRYLLVTDEELPASAFFEVRAESATAYPALSGLTGPEDLLIQPPEGWICESATISAKEWIRCESPDAPLSVMHYSMTGSTVYSVAFNSDTSPADGQAIGLMFDSLQFFESGH